MESEEKLNRIPIPRLRLMCQFDINRFGPEIFDEIVRLHPMSVISDMLNDMMIPRVSMVRGPQVAAKVLIGLLRQPVSSWLRNEYGTNPLQEAVKSSGGMVKIASRVVVYFSYCQTIAAYPNGGGSYTVRSKTYVRVPRFSQAQRSPSITYSTSQLGFLRALAP